MDLSFKDACLVCGYESGHIVLWGLLRTDLLRMIPPPEKSPVLAVKFWKDVKNNILVANAKGIVYMYKVEYSFFQWSVEKKPLLDLSTPDKKVKGTKPDPTDTLPDGFFSIQLLNKRDTANIPELNKHTIIAIGSMKMILILTIEPTVGIVYKFPRPSGLADPMIPSLSWGKGSIPGKLTFILYFL